MNYDTENSLAADENINNQLTNIVDALFSDMEVVGQRISNMSAQMATFSLRVSSSENDMKLLRMTHTVDQKTSAACESIRVEENESLTEGDEEAVTRAAVAAALEGFTSSTGGLNFYMSSSRPNPFGVEPSEAKSELDDVLQTPSSSKVLDKKITTTRPGRIEPNPIFDRTPSQVSNGDVPPIIANLPQELPKPSKDEKSINGNVRADRVNKANTKVRSTKSNFSSSSSSRSVSPMKVVEKTSTSLFDESDESEVETNLNVNSSKINRNPISTRVADMTDSSIPSSKKKTEESKVTFPNGDEQPTQEILSSSNDEEASHSSSLTSRNTMLVHDIKAAISARNSRVSNNTDTSNEQKINKRSDAEKPKQELKSDMIGKQEPLRAEEHLAQMKTGPLMDATRVDKVVENSQIAAKSAQNIQTSGKTSSATPSMTSSTNKTQDTKPIIQSVVKAGPSQVSQKLQEKKPAPQPVVKPGPSQSAITSDKVVDSKPLARGDVKPSQSSNVPPKEVAATSSNVPPQRSGSREAAKKSVKSLFAASDNDSSDEGEISSIPVRTAPSSTVVIKEPAKRVNPTAITSSSIFSDDSDGDDLFGPPKASQKVVPAKPSQMPSQNQTSGQASSSLSSANKKITINALNEILSKMGKKPAEGDETEHDPLQNRTEADVNESGRMGNSNEKQEEAGLTHLLKARPPGPQNRRRPTRQPIASVFGDSTSDAEA